MNESFRTELDSNRMEDMLWGFIMTEFFDKGSFSNIISSQDNNLDKKDKYIQ